MKAHLLLAPLFFAIGLSAQAQCSVDLPNDTVTVYEGYQPLACSTLVPTMNGAIPSQLLWSNGTTSASLTVCDTVSSWYYVTLTDDTLCTATDSVFVQVVDVRCGDNGNKVLVCHIPPGNPANAHTICISPNGVPAHLAHGCHLGTCAAPPDSSGIDGLVMQVTPNPMNEQASVSLTSTTDQHVRVRVVDAMGRQLLILMDAAVPAYTPVTMPLNDHAIPSGISVVWVEVQGDHDRIARAVVIER
jgi:hypothetical protein